MGREGGGLVQQGGRDGSTWTKAGKSGLTGTELASCTRPQAMPRAQSCLQCTLSVPVRPTGGSGRCKRLPCPRRGKCCGSHQGAVRPGSGAKSQGARGTAAAARQGPAWPPDTAPSSQIRFGKETQPNSQGKWPLSVASPSLPTAGLSWLARSLRSRKVIRGNVPIWDAAGPQAASWAREPVPTRTGAGEQHVDAPWGPRHPPLQPTQRSTDHHGWVLSVPRRPPAELLGWE